MYTKSFGGISKKDVGIAGGKGASLGEMARVGFPVPGGFVVLAGSFDRFLEESGLTVEIEASLDGVNYNDVNSVEVASEKIRDMIKDSKFPEDIGKEIIGVFRKLGVKRVAVRSSATAEDSSIASWAGELESYLNVTEGSVLEYVKKCWSSLFTPRAILYRYSKNLQDQKVSVAVVVQEMRDPEVAGVCFTVHPVTTDANQMVIEAGYGLGEAIVGGLITPDTYIIKKKEMKIENKKISEQKVMTVMKTSGTDEVNVPLKKRKRQKLSDKNILEIATICKKIEKHYGKPQDIEWLFEKGKFYILQSRPITTL